MNNYDAFTVALEWVFDFISQHWVFILIPITFSMSLSMYKSLVGCSRRRPLPTPSAAPRSGPVSASVPRPVPVVAPAPSAPAPVRCEGCSDCPFFADTGIRDDACPLHGTSSCAVGLYVSGGKLI